MSLIRVDGNKCTEFIGSWILITSGWFLDFWTFLVFFRIRIEWLDFGFGWISQDKDSKVGFGFFGFLRIWIRKLDLDSLDFLGSGPGFGFGFFR
jgi:hypothetical protein